ncbi:L,D-transpeptidase family protein [Sphingomonas sp. G-3-2-10]|uniref:L,D-transpeptidase family protein n=1 Tax=Sphingomonas sp. G-3-2-10 TaxID=2728838 RepID=UPI003216DBF5
MAPWRVLAVSIAGIMGLGAVPAAAQVIQPNQIELISLKPGQYMWFETMTPAGGYQGPVSIVVSIPAQVLYVYRGGALIGVSTVSTGKAGKETPTGEFTILQKKTFHRSNLYSNAPMPFMQRLTWDGIALHAGHLPGYPASHGCIRLPKEFAKQLYSLTEMGGTVSVIDETVDDPRSNPWAPPTLYANPGDFAGERYNIVTASVQRPPSLAPVKGDGARPTSSSWVTGPAAEVVQPLPRGTR